MKILTRLSIILIPLMLAALACSFNATTANIAEATMARDPDGNEPTTVFTPQEPFYLVVQLNNAPDDTTLKAVWTAVNVEGVEPNLYIDEASLATGSGEVNFNLTGEDPWPAGDYKVDLYLNDELERTLEFEVQP